MTVIPVSCIYRGRINITFILETSSQVSSAESIRRGIWNKAYMHRHQTPIFDESPLAIALDKKAYMLVSSINPSERLKERTVDSFVF